MYRGNTFVNHDVYRQAGGRSPHSEPRWGDSELGLQLVSDSSPPTAATLAVAAHWVHSSNLRLPAPFLADGHVLLATGTWLEGPATDIDAYVRRLVDRGLVGFVVVS